MDGHTLMGHLDRLVRVYQAEGFSGDLRPSQWHALRYFANAGPDERTLTHFARARATTMGTASITVSGLVEKGLMTRGRDGRNVDLEVSDEGWRLLESHDPYRHFAAALERLSDDQKRALVAASEAILAERCPAGEDGEA